MMDHRGEYDPVTTLMEHVSAIKFRMSEYLQKTFRFKIKYILFVHDYPALTLGEGSLLMSCKGPCSLSPCLKITRIMCR